MSETDDTPTPRRRIQTERRARPFRWGIGSCAAGLIILVLGYIGWDLGTHHSKRATLLAEARELVTADWVRATYRNDFERAQSHRARALISTHKVVPFHESDPRRSTIHIDGF